MKENKDSFIEAEMKVANLAKKAADFAKSKEWGLMALNSTNDIFMDFLEEELPGITADSIRLGALLSLSKFFLIMNANIRYEKKYKLMFLFIIPTIIFILLAIFVHLLFLIFPIIHLSYIIINIKTFKVVYKGRMQTYNFLNDYKNAVRSYYQTII